MAKKAAHHGGAWKVAYADFVTAMMALFMVLWISAQDKQILLATSKYFQHPFHSPFEDHSGIMPFNKELRDGSGGSKKDNDENASNPKSASDARQIELNFLNSVAADYKKLIRMDEDLDKKPIDIQVTSDGLRITLFDRARRPLFDEQTTKLTPWGQFVIQNLAWLIERYHFRVIIDGHTRSNLQLPGENYTSWELSADRANSARRSLVHYAVDPASVERVTGYGDTRPVDGEPPDSESNQRITLSLSLAQIPGSASREAPGAGEPEKAPAEPPRLPPVAFTPPKS
ncbi:MAG TPA: flagellar motor protein MotB [Opitutaceae bacterium]|nr:flagellar motor protein MotB [Opitutaceae bacterium]